MEIDKDHYKSFIDLFRLYTKDVGCYSKGYEKSGTNKDDILLINLLIIYIFSFKI